MDPCCDDFLHDLPETAQKANDPVGLCSSVGGLTLLAQQYALSCLLSARVVTFYYAAPYKRDYPIFSPLLQQPERFEADAVYSRGFVDSLSEQCLTNFIRIYVSR